MKAIFWSISCVIQNRWLTVYLPARKPICSSASMLLFCVSILLFIIFHRFYFILFSAIFFWISQNQTFFYIVDTMFQLMRACHCVVMFRKLLEGIYFIVFVTKWPKVWKKFHLYAYNKNRHNMTEMIIDCYQTEISFRNKFCSR